MGRINRATVAVAVATTLTLGAAGCGSGDAGGDDELIVGTIMPMSGPQKALSNSYRSMQAYFDARNADGGVGGIKIKLVVQDDQFNAVNTPAAARKVVEQDKAQMLCGNQGSATFKAISPYLKGRGIGSIPMTGESSLFQGASTGFQLLTPYELTGAHLVRHAVQKMKLDKIAIAYTDDGIGQPFLKGAREQLAAMGVKPVAEVKVNAASPDQSPAAAKLKTSGAQIVLFNHVAPVVAQLVRSSDRLGFRPQWGLTYAALNRQVAQLSGAALDGRAVFATPFPGSDDAALRDYRQAMTTDHPKVDRTDFLSVEGWVAGSVCADVIERAAKTAGGRPTAKQLTEALAQTTVDNDLVRGLRWTKKTRIGQRNLQVVALKGKSFETTDTYRPAPQVATDH